MARSLHPDSILIHSDDAARFPRTTALLAYLDVDNALTVTIKSWPRPDGVLECLYRARDAAMYAALDAGAWL